MLGKDKMREYQRERREKLKVRSPDMVALYERVAVLEGRCVELRAEVELLKGVVSLGSESQKAVNGRFKEEGDIK